MSNFGAFLPQGNTTAIAIGASASTPVQINAANNAGVPNMNAYLICATVACLICLTPASTSVTIPVAGTPANGIYVPAGIPMLLEGPPNAWVSVIEAPSGSTGTVYITPGDGASH
jgi:hypothetical protein